MTTALAEPRTQIQLDRRALLLALSRVERVALQRSYKPILAGVRLHAEHGWLHLAATNLELTIMTRVPAASDLPACVVPCSELARRIKASRNANCTLQLDGEHDQLVINGGLVEHAIHTLPVEDFPVVPVQTGGQIIRVQAEELKAALKTASMAMSRVPGRYAVDAILAESDGKGLRLVATDGRRLVIAELEQAETDFQGQVILPKPWIAVANRLADPKQDETLALNIDPQPDRDGKPQPARVSLVGTEWSLSGTAHDGFFPIYRDVVPKSGKRFVVDRELFLSTLNEVTLATDLDSKGVGLELTAEQVALSASSAEKDSATGSVPVITTNASTRKIVTAFNPGFLREAVRSLDCQRVVIDVQPNQRSKLDGSIIQKPGLIYPEDGTPVQWVVMPVTIGSSRK